MGQLLQRQQIQDLLQRRYHQFPHEPTVVCACKMWWPELAVLSQLSLLRSLLAAGLAVPAVMAGQVSTGLTASVSLQISLAAAVAVARGFDENDSRFDQMVFMLLPVIRWPRGSNLWQGLLHRNHSKNSWYRRQKSSNDVLWPIVGQKL